MTEYPNPFTPSFGEVPAHLAGRGALLAPLERAFATDGRAPELTTLITGARGTGKTTLLSVVAAKAAAQGWICAEVTASSGMLEDVYLRARKASAHIVEPHAGTRIKGIGIPNVISLELRQTNVDENWRLRMESVLDGIEQCGSSLLITVDEVDPALAELKQLAVVYQHFVRENRRVALVMAGLPHNVTMLQDDKAVTFLRRSHLFPLGPLADDEVFGFLSKAVAEGGRTASARDLLRATEAIRGFPYLMQLVGYRMWDANPTQKAIGPQDVETGIIVAKAEMERQILQATYRDLSDGDLAFLEAMLEDDGDSRTADIGARLGASTSLTAQYRRRLVDAGVIGERRRGVVGFDLPFFREFLLERRG